tara:strand:- start:236 stop:670 length:435 start_codon:yes stop_codon:yes gene_type:complete
MENINFIEPDIFLIAGTLIILFLSVFVIFLYQLFQNSKTLKEITNIKKDIFNVSKLIEIQNSQSTQVNNNFEIIQKKVKDLEDIVEMTNREISIMSEGISGEVGVNKAIELARKGASFEEVKKNVNLNDEQAKLIIKFHGKKLD